MWRRYARTHLLNTLLDIYLTSLTTLTPSHPPSSSPPCSQWWHRSLNVKKLVEVGWIALTARETMQRNIRKYALPDRTKYVHAVYCLLSTFY